MSDEWQTKFRKQRMTDALTMMADLIQRTAIPSQRFLFVFKHPL